MSRDLGELWERQQSKYEPPEASGEDGPLPDRLSDEQLAGLRSEIAAQFGPDAVDWLLQSFAGPLPESTVDALGSLPKGFPATAAQFIEAHDLMRRLLGDLRPEPTDERRPRSTEQGVATDSAADEVELRRAAATDASEIAELFLASFKATYDFPLAHTDEQVRRWIAEVLLPTDEVWVASNPAGEIVGLMALSVEMLEELYVAPGQTGRGIGGRLVELAKQRRPNGLDLYTFQVNHNARAFYEGREFRQVWLGDGSANEEGQPDVRYAWRPADAAQPDSSPARLP